MSDETKKDCEPGGVISLDFDLMTKPGIPLPKRRRKAPGEAAGTRKEHDAYDTPPALALACAEWLEGRLLSTTTPPFCLPGSDGTLHILEPTAGGGPFVKAARQTWPKAVIAAVDIRPECQKPCEDAGATIFACADSISLNPKTIHSADLILTNPPFKLADVLARQMYLNMHDGAVLAFLLSVTFIASEDRWVPGGDTKRRRGRSPGPGLFTIAPLTYMAPIVPRPSFLVIDGKAESPKQEMALFVWVKGRGYVEEKGWAPQGASIPREPIRWEKSG